MDSLRTSGAAQARVGLRDYALLVLRVGMALAFLLFHGIRGLLRAWQYGAEGTAWGWVSFIEGKGLPLPGLVAIVFAVVAALGALLLMAGLLTRLTALVLGMGVFVVLGLHFGQPEMCERLLLYLVGLAALLVGGAGRLSGDAVIHGRLAPGNASRRHVL